MFQPNPANPPQGVVGPTAQVTVKVARMPSFV